MKIIRMKGVASITGLSRATIYRQMSKGVFPASVSLGENSIGWIESEIESWILEKMEARDNAILVN